MELKLREQFLHITLDSTDVEQLQNSQEVTHTQENSPISTEVVIAPMINDQAQRSTSPTEFSRIDSVVNSLMAPPHAVMGTSLRVYVPNVLLNPFITNAAGIPRHEIEVSDIFEREDVLHRIPSGGIIVEFPHLSPLVDTLYVLYSKESAAS